MTKRCCFAGHAKIGYSDETYSKLIALIEKLVDEHDVSEFLVGNYGNFDNLCVRAVRQVKTTYPHIRLTLVLPYLTEDINRNRQFYNRIFDGILMADIPYKTPKKLYILKCNEYMVNTSEFLICYVSGTFGGAYRTMHFAEKNRIKIFNIAL